MTSTPRLEMEKALLETLVSIFVATGHEDVTVFGDFSACAHF